ncbi:hypothetical protein K7X08_023595 [Anisodus acutangulus]|uniref:Uncharacterized protein n=1 Tax=Anisodus acutangulus TaxID=402998 RepID=A0A9Q1LBA7_9SOLA|nr:hypothetical protein K7X08_023595 [Anisodus acutangulus]
MFPVVIIESSTSEEQEDVGDNSDEESCGNSKRKKMGSKMRCHQCKLSDKDRVVCCSKCKVKRYLLPCITRWE